MGGSGLHFAREFAVRVPGKLVVLSEEDELRKVVETSFPARVYDVPR